MPEEELDVAVLGTVLEDDCARTILEATVREPKSADELVAECEVSRATVYRRLDDLEEHALLSVRQHPDAEGHHYKVYVAALDRVVVDLTPQGMELSLRRRDQMTERLRRFIEGL
ncbi:MAG: ArsR/SmtB family transcription factor [Halanaeroarchaeum sp.]